MKILIFGTPGSGKTLLARKLSKSLDLPIFHIDKYFFEKGWIERDHDHFLQDVKEVVKTENWIIDGNGMRSLEMRYSQADLAIYCNFPRFLCLYRIFYRWISTFNKAKEDGPEGSKNSVSWRLVKYLWKFNAKYKAQIDGLKKKYPDVEFLELGSKTDLKSFEKELLK